MVTRKLSSAALAALTLFSLAACASNTAGEEVLLFPDRELYENRDPSDSTLHASIQSYLEQRGGPKHSQYDYVRTDLNGDGRREALVLFNLPHNYWCGWSGCTLAVFGVEDENFVLVSETSRIRGPLFVGGTQTNGWEDIGVRVSGTESPDRNVVLRYDGTAYPENPLDQSGIPFDLAALGGTRVFP
jgi:hypothetical protein